MDGNNKLILALKRVEKHSLKLLILLIIFSSMNQVAASQIIDEYDSSSTHTPLNQKSSFDSLENSSSPKKYIGKQRTLVILVEFIDIKHSHSESEINQLIFINMNNYWKEVSYDTISITGKTTGWYTLRKKMAYYGADSDHTIDDPDGDGLSDGRKLIHDVVNIVDEDIDFKEYHHIMIVHAGIGQESNPKASDNIWSSFVNDTSITTNDGVTVTAGIIVPEGEFLGGAASVLGVFAHEFGHSLGLPDIYSVRSKGIETLGDWSLMDHGEWLGVPSGSRPSHLESWGKIQLGWLTPLAIHPKGQIVSISRLESKIGFPKAVKISITDEEYYLIEVRQRIGFDSSLPGEGVLIMRINEARKSGEGIIRLLDNTPSTIKLHDAAFQVGDIFEDYVNNIYIKIFSKNGSSYQIILSQKPILTSKLYTFDTISANYLDEVEFSVFLANSEGIPLPHMIVLFEYGKGEKWTYLGRSVTEDSGYAFLKTTLDLHSGNYMLRYFFTGGELGDHYYLSNSTYSTLIVTKKKVTLNYDIPTKVTAFNQITLKIFTMSDKKPIPNVPLHVYLDEEIYEKKNSSEDGLIIVTFNFDVFDLGIHKIRLEVPENEFFEKNISYSVFSVYLPLLLLTLIFIVLIFLVFIITKKFKFKIVKSIKYQLYRWIYVTKALKNQKSIY